MLSSRVKSLILVICCGCLLVSPAWAALQLTYTWDPPTTGSPVVEYQVEWKTGSGDFEPLGVVTEALIRVDVPDGTQGLVLRVAGRDQWGRQGLWSPPSVPWTDDGTPGPPTEPSIIEIIALAGFGLLALLIGTVWKVRRR